MVGHPGGVGELFIVVGTPPSKFGIGSRNLKDGASEEWWRNQQCFKVTGRGFDPWESSWDASGGTMVPGPCAFVEAVYFSFPTLSVRSLSLCCCKHHYLYGAWSYGQLETMKDLQIVNFWRAGIATDPQTTWGLEVLTLVQSELCV